MKTAKICPHCSTTFEGRSNQLYCSSTCKQLAFQQRQGPPVVRATTIISGSDSNYTQPGQSSKPTGRFAPPVTAKATVEIEKLRIESSEKLRRLELEERKQERRYEQEKEERRYKQELELAERNSRTESQKWGAEQGALLNRLDGLEKKLTSPLVHIPDDKIEEDQSDNDGSGTGLRLFLGIVGAVAVAALIKRNQPSKQPVSTLDGFAKKHLTKPALVPPPTKTDTDQH